MTPLELAKKIDHTLLKPETTGEDIRRLCQEAKTYGFAAVCIAPLWARLASEELRSSDIAIATVIGFPHGATFSIVKALEAKKALELGANELDVVIPIGALKSGKLKEVLDDISAIVEVARQRPHILVKVILETSLLTRAEVEIGCDLVEKAGADFVKTSTGFGPPLNADTLLEHVRILKTCVGERLGIKAAGGIRTYSQAIALIEVGATRLGCSASISILKQAE